MQQLLLIIDTHWYLSPVDMNSRKIASKEISSLGIAVHCECCGHRSSF